MNNWITFCGDSYSGSTIVVAIIDSHPNVRLTYEQRYLRRYHWDGWSKDKILQHLLTGGQGRRIRSVALPGSGPWTTRENQESLLAIGDKYGHDPYLLSRKHVEGIDGLDKFSAFIELPIKIVHTIRNPYDNIAAYIDNRKQIIEVPNDEERCEQMINNYEKLYEIFDLILNRYSHFNLHNDSLIKDPRGELIRLCEYLEIPVVEPWLTTAVAAVFTKPRTRKDNREWLPGIKKEIEVRLINKYSYFNRYK